MNFGDLNGGNIGEKPNYTQKDIDFLDQRKSVESLQKFVDDRNGQ
jgi:hypothetical protein